MIERELTDQHPTEVSAALERLAEIGVIDVAGDKLAPSRCTTYLDRIGMVAI
jgi:hypothetical protein